jgi:hypothetical protein
MSRLQAACHQPLWSKLLVKQPLCRCVREPTFVCELLELGSSNLHKSESDPRYENTDSKVVFDKFGMFRNPSHCLCL